MIFDDNGPDFDEEAGWPLKMERLRELYESRDEGVGSNVRFMNDQGSFFVVEDCGGALNFHIFGTDGNTAFESLEPPEVVRLFNVLKDRVRDYPLSVKGGWIDPFQIRIIDHPRKPW